METTGRGTFIPYQKTYFDLVPAGDLVDLITNQFNDTETLLLRLSDDQAGRTYAPGKWTIKGDQSPGGLPNASCVIVLCASQGRTDLSARI